MLYVTKKIIKKVKFDKAHYQETLKGIKECIQNPKELLLAKDNQLGKEAMHQALNAIKALHYEQVAHGLKKDSWDNIYNGLPFQIVTICDKRTSLLNKKFHKEKDGDALTSYHFMKHIGNVINQLYSDFNYVSTTLKKYDIL